MTRGVAISYGDVAIGAKESFSYTPSESQFSVGYIEQLKQYNMQLYNYANPCEKYQTLLDGSQIAFPSKTVTANVGLWSVQLSRDDCTFATPITLTLENSGQYSSQGFTFTFDKFNDIHPAKMTIQWYRGNTALTDPIEYNPTSGFYFCRKKVDNFNKVVITFYSLNLPQNRLKVYAIDYGYGTVFYGDELRNVKLTQTIDPISSEISINTCDFTLDSKSDMEYSFQSKQPLSVYYNDILQSTSFVRNSKRKAKFLWDVNAEDYIGLLDSIPYRGGMFKDLSARSLMVDIFLEAKVPYNIDAAFNSIMLTGYIPYTSCREALKQVCFAAQAVVDTSGSDRVNIKLLDDKVKQTIPKRRIMQGQSFEDGDTVTKVELTAHTYTAITDTLEAYKAEDSGTGKNIMVKFSEPLHDLSITNGDITSAGANYAIINANSGCVLTGQKYEHKEHVESMSNPTVLVSELENVMEIPSATLVGTSNVKSVLEKCFNWLTSVNTVSLSIVEGKQVVQTGAKYGRTRYGQAKYGKPKQTIAYDTPVKLGDVLESETEYLGIVKGRLIEQSYDLNSNIIVKEAVLG